MRAILNAILAVLILACPLLCGAGEVFEDAHAHAAASDSPPLDHCPENSDDCICRGAVQVADVRAPLAHLVGHHFDPVEIVGLFAHDRAHSHLTTAGTPAGLAAWGDSLAVRALLQNFRF